MNEYSVYVHTFPNGKKYVGITRQAPAKRWAGGNGYKDCPKMWAAVQKYGWTSVEHRVLFKGLTKEEAENEERRLIKELSSVRNGYNIEYGGNAIGTHNEATKRKISEANRGKHHRPLTESEKAARAEAMRGQKNPFFGRSHSDECKAKQSERMKGNQFNKGKRHTEAFKKWKAEQMCNKYKNGGNPRCRKVLMITEEGAETAFFSLRKAAENARVSPATLLKAIRSGAKYNGFYWRYANETGS